MTRYGFRVVDGELVEDEEEQAVPDPIRDMRPGGVTLRAVADALGVERNLPRLGGRWPPFTVARLLNNEVSSR